MDSFPWRWGFCPCGPCPCSALLSSFPHATAPPPRSFAVLPAPLKAEAGAPRSQGTAGVFGKCFHLVALRRNDCLGDARLHPHEPSWDRQCRGRATPLLLPPAPPRLSWGTRFLWVPAAPTPASGAQAPQHTATSTGAPISWPRAPPGLPLQLWGRGGGIGAGPGARSPAACTCRHTSVCQSSARSCRTHYAGGRRCHPCLSPKICRWGEEGVEKPGAHSGEHQRLVIPILLLPGMSSETPGKSLLPAGAAWALLLQEKPLACTWVSH